MNDYTFMLPIKADENARRFDYLTRICVDDPNRQFFNCLRVEEEDGDYILVTTDGTCLNTLNIEKKMAETTYRMKPGTYMVKREKDKIVCETSGETFPNWRRILPEADGVKTTGKVWPGINSKSTLTSKDKAAILSAQAMHLHAKCGIFFNLFYLDNLNLLTEDMEAFMDREQGKNRVIFYSTKDARLRTILMGLIQ